MLLSVSHPLFDNLADFQDMLLTKRRTVHGTSSLHKIVASSIRNRYSFFAPPRKPLQMGVRIEDVVIIADHRIHPNREIQRHLKRTDRMLSGICLDLIPAHIINMGEHVKDRIVDPVKMPLGVDAGIPDYTRSSHRNRSFPSLSE